MPDIDPVHALFSDPVRMNRIGRQAARAAILEHRRAGVPMAIGMPDGQVRCVDPFSVELPPEELIEPVLRDESVTG